MVVCCGTTVEWSLVRLPVPSVCVTSYRARNSTNNPLASSASRSQPLVSPSADHRANLKNRSSWCRCLHRTIRRWFSSHFQRQPTSDPIIRHYASTPHPSAHANPSGTRPRSSSTAYQLYRRPYSLSDHDGSQASPSGE